MDPPALGRGADQDGPMVVLQGRGEPLRCVGGFRVHESNQRPSPEQGIRCRIVGHHPLGFTNLTNPAMVEQAIRQQNRGMEAGRG